MRYLLPILTIACQSIAKKEQSDASDNYQTPDHHSATLISVLDAHGGYKQWMSMKSLSYQKAGEMTITNLQDRRIRLESSDRTIGFDGQQVWVYPDTIDASRARFYHNLYFYFFAMPFVIGDPGAHYEEIGERQLMEKNYSGIKVSFNDGVGDASDDNYILWTDPETHQMAWLMYTVTYRSGQPSDRYNLIKYDDWSRVNGLLLPTKLQWYHYRNDSIGEMRSEVIFENIQLSEQPPLEELFIMPDGAQIAPR